MKYLFKVLPIPERAWVKALIGFLWIAEASFETYAFYTYAPLYIREIIGPIDIFVLLSTYFAVAIGAIHLGLAIVQWRNKIAAWRGYTN
jgi:hypothetical protein